jgi:hypothetical protein
MGNRASDKETITGTWGRKERSSDVIFPVCGKEENVYQRSPRI